MNTFIAEYEHQGKLHQIRFEAESWDQAEDLVEDIACTINLSGKLVEEWPAEGV